MKNSKIRLSLMPLRILARTGSSGLFAPFCPLAFLLSAYQSEGWLVGAVGIELLELLKRRKLLILRNDKNEKHCTNAEPRYTAGTPIHRGHSLGVP
jgi:hypothetical protein